MELGAIKSNLMFPARSEQETSGDQAPNVGKPEGFRAGEIKQDPEKADTRVQRVTRIEELSIW